MFEGTIQDDSEFFNIIIKFINSEKIKESLRSLAKEKLKYQKANDTYYSYQGFFDTSDEDQSSISDLN